MKNPAYFSYAVKAILATAFLVLVLNFACANGSGAKLLSLFGLVAEHEIAIRSNILRGVNLMQGIIKVVAVVGGACFSWFIYKGVKAGSINYPT
ncbi:MAG: hypothetical protein OQK04_06410 [Kangiellaceae bacterium]|nr:hypothetical protein [Kangiellaceae bacterium]MCW8998331.1 hypothetical protein [Kangiellaceae bacterium]